jgi:5-methylcytosine-specific restriction protein A
MDRRDQRSPEARAYRRLYNDPRWKHPTRGLRARQLREHPLCQRCDAKGYVVAATICDHDDPATKTPETFFDGPFVSLCKPCHDGPKQSQERTRKANTSVGYSKAVDRNGMPTDPRHPWFAG